MASRRQRRILYSVEPYKLWALAPHGLRLRGLSASGDDLETYTYIYCIKLPDFECQTIHPPQQTSFSPLSPQQRTAIMNSLFLHDPEGLQALLDARSYTMVKVGISTNPASRLCVIMRGFEEFGAHDTGFSAIRESDPPDDTVRKGREEDKVVFIKKCRNIEDAESQIRRLIGQQLGQTFQDQFTENLGANKESVLGQVGMTEWVLIKTDLMKAIQKQYRENWRSVCFGNYQRKVGVGVLFGPRIPTGQEFCRQLRSFSVSFCQRNGMIAHTHEVIIKFPPGFTFTLRIMRVHVPFSQAFQMMK